MASYVPEQRDAEQHMLQTPEVDRLRTWSRLYSTGAHLAGDKAHAQGICDLWRSYGIQAELVRYDVLQNFPISSSLMLHAADGSIAYRATLVEDELAEDPTSSPLNGLPAFHGFAANGKVQAELVYANFATPEDFANLAAQGVDVRGKIVLCKYAKIFRGLKVRAAEQAGAVGVIMYNDPQEDGEYTAKNGYAAYPHGPARHPSSIQRGSVDFFSVAVGDPTTPGYPSLPGIGADERRDPHHAIPRIPSLPISFADATPFLQALSGRGKSAEDMSRTTPGWRGEIEGVDYSTGPTTVKVSLSSQGEFKYAPIYNVIGTIAGETDQSIVLGNHHDSWCCGAVDPFSGSAAMNEVVRGLGELMRRGWKPYRKLILCSWDNEEYGLVGSTEWVEDNAKELSANCVAYLNVDEATNGGRFLGVVGSPLLAEVLRSTTQLVPSPVYNDKTVYDDWLADLRQRRGGDPTLPEPRLSLMGTGSDYTAFYHHLGIPSIDMLFNQQGQGVYPYHSNYDSYYWLDKFGDVGFRKHRAMAQLWGLVAVRLAGHRLLPFRAADYADALVRNLAAVREGQGSGGGDGSGGDLDYAALEAAVDRFRRAAEDFDAQVARLESSQAPDPGRLDMLNRGMIQLERMFLKEKGDGLKGRPWYRHQIFAPGLWLGYDGVAFPALQEALDKENFAEAGACLRDLKAAVAKATAVLASSMAA